MMPKNLPVSNNLQVTQTVSPTSTVIKLISINLTFRSVLGSKPLLGNLEDREQVHADLTENFPLKIRNS